MSVTDLNADIKAALTKIVGVSAPPFRWNVQKLRYRETHAEATQLLYKLCCFLDIPLHVTSTLIGAYRRECPNGKIVATHSQTIEFARSGRPDLTNDQHCGDNIVDGPFFCRAVIADFADFCKKLLNDTNNTYVHVRRQLNTVKNVTPRYSVASIRNQRRTNEDRHLALESLVGGLHGAVTDEAPSSTTHEVYAVFDGHGGEAIANYVHTHIVDHLFAADAFSASDSEWSRRSVEAMQHAFTTLDTAVLAKANDDPKIPGGSTAAVAIVRRWPAAMNKRPHVTVAWCGDSRVLLVGSNTAMTLTAPAHTTAEESERERVEQNGGRVLNLHGEWRVNGLINVTRAFGDISCRPGLDSTPDVMTLEIDDTYSYLILCCDGVYDAFESRIEQELIEILRTHKANGNSSDLADYIVKRAKDKGATDNLTCIVVLL